MSGKRILGFILTFFCIALPFIAWYVALQICRGQREIHVKKMKCAAIWSSIGFAVAITFLFISMLMYIVNDIETDMSIGLGLNSLAAWFYYQARCFLNYIFVGRLYYAFANSHMAYSNRLIYALLVLITINLISLNFVSFSWFICPACGLYFFTINILFDITLPIILSVLFIRKLLSYATFNQPTNIETSTTSVTSATSTGGDNTERDMATTMRFQNTVVRSTVLTIFAMISSWIIAITIFILFFDVVTYDPFTFFMWEFLVILDSAVNTFCLLFYFALSPTIYGIMCGKIHRYCLSMYGNKARAKDRNNSKKESSQGTHNEKKSDKSDDVTSNPNMKVVVNDNNKENVSNV